jgi:hypothetical protein
VYLLSFINWITCCILATASENKARLRYVWCQVLRHIGNDPVPSPAPIVRFTAGKTPERIRKESFCREIESGSSNIILHILPKHTWRPACFSAHRRDTVVSPAAQALTWQCDVRNPRGDVTTG